VGQPWLINDTGRKHGRKRAMQKWTILLEGTDSAKTRRKKVCCAEDYSTEMEKRRQIRLRKRNTFGQWKKTEQKRPPTGRGNRGITRTARREKFYLAGREGWGKRMSVSLETKRGERRSRAVTYPAVAPAERTHRLKGKRRLGRANCV